MKRGLVIGRTNVGKTLFCIQFAEYMGLRDLQWLIERTDGRTEQRRMSLSEAKSTLSDATSHRTRSLQSLRLELPRGKGSRQLLVTDTTGLADGIHPETRVRESMAQTLLALIESPVVLHIVDAAKIGKEGGELNSSSKRPLGSGWSNLDEQVAALAAHRPGYLILANKLDLPGARSGYRMLSNYFSRHKVIPVSALQGTGFREVKQHVWRMV